MSAMLAYAAHTTYAVVTHQQGSWRWQKRYAIATYCAHVTRDGRHVWRSMGLINNKVKPAHKQALVSGGMHYGSLHNRPIVSQGILPAIAA